MRQIAWSRRLLAFLLTLSGFMVSYSNLKLAFEVPIKITSFRGGFVLGRRMVRGWIIGEVRKHKKRVVRPSGEP